MVKKSKIPDFGDPKWNLHRQEQLEKTLIKTCRELIQHTGSPTFRFQIEGTFPPIFLVCGTAESIQNVMADETPARS